MAESNRIQKINQLFQEELAEVVRKKSRVDYPGVLVSVTEVKVTQDLSIAKAYVSIFPTKNREQIFNQIQEEKAFYRNQLGQSVANKMRKVPDINFYLDLSLERSEEIEQALKGNTDNPIL